MALLAALLLSGLAAGCGLDTRFKETFRPLSLSFAATYTEGRTDLTVHYSVPPPDPGMVYVMWAYDQNRQRVAKLGAVPAGVEHTVKASAPFRVVGVIITQEASPDVTRMVGTGVIELELEDQNFDPPAGRGSGNQRR